MKRTSNAVVAILSMTTLAVACGAGTGGLADDGALGNEVHQSTDELNTAAFCARPCMLPKDKQKLSQYLRERAGCIEVCDGVDNNCNGTVDEGVSNACGGCAALPAEVDSACRSGNQCGTYACDGKDALKCDALRSENACGGCAVLDGAVGGECTSGDQCGTYACAGEDALVCGSLHACDVTRPDWDAAACQSWVNTLYADSESMFFGSYVERADSTDPTGGYLLGNVPPNGEWHAQLFASYVACDDSTVNVQGFAGGNRVGNDLGVGEWFLDLLEGDFWGTFAGTVANDGNTARGAYDTTGGDNGGQLIPGQCNAAGDGAGWGAPGCYCSSPGTWEARKVSSMAATFGVAACQGSHGVEITSSANPKPFMYTIFNASKACRKEMPIVAICPEERQDRGRESACWANVPDRCKIAKISDINPGIIDCGCIYFSESDPFVPGDTYLVVGASTSEVIPNTPVDFVNWMVNTIRTYLTNPAAVPTVTAYPVLYKQL